MSERAKQMTLFDLGISCGKMFPEHSAPQAARTSELSWRKSSELRTIPVQCLDLTPGNGNLLGLSYWDINSAWLGVSWTLNTGASPKEGVASSLSQILEDSPHPKYYLSKTACLGILRRAEARGKELPSQLKRALEIQAQLLHPDGQPTELEAYHINQRDEGINSNGISGALMATSNMQMQTFITQPDKAGPMEVDRYTSFAANQRDEVRKKAGDCTPTVLCLNDQGGQRIDCTIDQTSTLRAQMGGHQPLVFDNHGQGARFRGPISKAQTVSVGFGGNNQPLIAQEPYTESCIAISGNIIDRQPHNGGNGFGCQSDLSYTLTGTDRHAVFNRQRVDLFRTGDITSTQSARQHKDATDLVCQPTYQETVDALTSSDRKGPNSQYVSQDKCVVEGAPQLIRRLTPLECERLQGFPDGWTLLEGASDSARYKALGNSVAIPCVDFVLRGITLFLCKNKEDDSCTSTPTT